MEVRVSLWQDIPILSNISLDIGAYDQDDVHAENRTCPVYVIMEVRNLDSSNHTFEKYYSMGVSVMPCIQLH